MNRFFIILLVTALLACGCTYRPSSHSTIIAGNDDKLYIATGSQTFSTRVKVYDVIDNKWLHDIELEGYDNPSISNIIIKNDCVYVSVQNIGLKPKGTLYKVVNATLAKVIEFNAYESLVGIDNNYYYVSKRVGHDEEGVKYDIKSGKRYTYHIDNNDMIVKDMYEDNDNFWYAGLKKYKNNEFGIMKHQLILAKRAKNDSNYEVYEADSHNWDGWGHAVTTIEINDSLCFFHINNDFPVGHEVIKFSKTSKKFDKISLPYSGTKPFRHVGNDGYVWLLGYPTNGQLKLLKYYIDSVKFDEVSLPSDVLTNGIIYDDKKYFWIDAYKMSNFAFTGNTAPFLLKVSRSDLSYVLIPVEPTFGQMIKTLFVNAGSIIIAPFFRQ